MKIIKVSLLIILLIFINSCGKENNLEENNYIETKKDIIEKTINECKITFETVEKDLVEFNLQDNLCNNGIFNLVSKEVPYNNETGNYTENKILLDEYDFRIKQYKMLYSSFDSASNDIINEEIILDKGYKLNLKLLAIYNFGVLGLEENELKQKLIDENIEYYVLIANIGNINIISNINKINKEELNKKYLKIKNDFSNIKILKEEIKETEFNGNNIVINTNFSNYNVNIKIINGYFGEDEAYDFSTIEGVCSPSSSNRGCKIYNIDEKFIYWGNEIIDKNTGEDILIKIDLKTDLSNGETMILE